MRTKDRIALHFIDHPGQSRVQRQLLVKELVGKRSVRISGNWGNCGSGNWGSGNCGSGNGGSGGSMGSGHRARHVYVVELT